MTAHDHSHCSISRGHRPRLQGDSDDE